MLRWMRSSLPARAGLAVALIALLAFTSAMSAGIIAYLSEDDAAAINTAGSLRMATYRLSWQLEADAPAEHIEDLRRNFELRLNSPELQHVLESDPAAPINSTYQSLLSRWYDELKPALLDGDKQYFLTRANDFVDQLDHFVLLLQHQSERKQGWQQTIQGAALLITVIILLVGMYELQTNVITPLQQMTRAAERFRKGDHSARVDFVAEDELGQMARSFNAMAATIEGSHRLLESRVASKTQYLARANDALQLLYRSSHSLAANPASAESLDRLLADFQECMPGLRLSLCLAGEDKNATDVLISLHGQEGREICSRSDCASCERRLGHNLRTFIISTQGVTRGQLHAYFVDGHTPLELEAELIQALADLVGTALSLERQREQDHRLVLLEERAVIARELHDSLAQSLSYMKLQISRLQALIQRAESKEQLQEVSQEMRDGINTAYRQLRELLTTFRLQIPGSGLDQALDDTVREFAERGGFQVLLESANLPFGLSANEQIHMLQIAREALSNCARHAQAQQVKVQLRAEADRVELHIEDDGVGIDADYDPRLHHGLHIMQERARSLGGAVDIRARAEGGTCVTLSFQPEFLRQARSESVA